MKIFYWIAEGVDALPRWCGWIVLPLGCALVLLLLLPFALMGHGVKLIGRAKNA
jgi:hypothetical protein